MFLVVATTGDHKTRSLVDRTVREALVPSGDAVTAAETLYAGTEFGW
jgi:hypothetical protein